MSEHDPKKWPMFDPVPPDVHEKIMDWTNRLPGWCPWQKAEEMYALAAREKPLLCVELGVYGGRSALPVALALRTNGQGRLVAIDPYDTAATQEGSTLPASEKWWRTCPLKELRDGFLREMSSGGLDPWIRFDEMKSLDAVVTFNTASIDILHVDGNHSTECAMADVQGYWPKLKDGAYVWLDDTNWETLKPVLEWLGPRAHLVAERQTWRLYQKL